MNPAQGDRVQAWRLERLCSGVLAAISGDASLHFRGRQLFRGEQRLAAPAAHLRLDHYAAGLDDWRGLTDATALRQCHSDPVLHRRLCPEDVLQGWLFDWLEQLRVETQLPAVMVGMACNIQQRFYRWSSHAYHAGLTETESGMLIYTLVQVCWSRLQARPVLAQTEDHIESCRAGLLSLLGDDLAGLRRQRQHQAAYAVHALRIARRVAQRLQHFSALQPGGKEENCVPTPRQQALALLLAPQDEDRQSPLEQARSAAGRVQADDGQDYRIFSCRHDVQWRAASKVRRTQLQGWRGMLDRRIAAAGINIPRLAQRVALRCSQPVMDGWRFGAEEGRLDGRRLAQLLSSPGERRLFRQQQYRLAADCAVTLLVDCSGSMKAFAEPLAILLDILLRVLDMAGIGCELLGFTTASWHGGRVLSEWRAQGQAPNPGRLNERCHLVFKDFSQSWRVARQDVAALLKTDLYREGLDGEAVDWACQRLQLRSERRRLLLVISDGSPTDSATAMANDPFYLDRHLQTVLARHRQQGQIDIMGLGLGLDLGAFYRSNLAIDLTQGVHAALVGAVVDLLMPARRP